MKNQIKVIFIESGSGIEATAHISCGTGCLVPNTDWQRISGSCNLLDEIIELGYQGVESVVKADYMLFSITTESLNQVTGQQF